MRWGAIRGGGRRESSLSEGAFGEPKEKKNQTNSMNIALYDCTLKRHCCAIILAGSSTTRSRGSTLTIYQVHTGLSYRILEDYPQLAFLVSPGSRWFSQLLQPPRTISSWTLSVTPSSGTLPSDLSGKIFARRMLNTFRLCDTIQGFASFSCCQPTPISNIAYCSEYPLELGLREFFLVLRAMQGNA